MSEQRFTRLWEGLREAEAARTGPGQAVPGADGGTATDGGRSADRLQPDAAPAAPAATGTPAGERPGTPELEAVLDIPVTLSVELGQSRLSIRQLLQLNPGSVVELDRLAGEPLDLLVNGTLVARGEVVVMNERFGIRLTDVVSARERLRRLR